jgi:hypothetical protein
VGNGVLRRTLLPKALNWIPLNYLIKSGRSQTRWLMPTIPLRRHRSRESQLEASMDKKLTRPVSQKNEPGIVECACDPSYLGGRRRRIKVQD